MHSANYPIRTYFDRTDALQGETPVAGPVQQNEPLLFAAHRLIQELTGFLCMKQAGITQLKLVLYHEDQRPTVVLLGLSVPSRDAQRISRLLRERLATLILPDRVEAIAIETRRRARSIRAICRCSRRSSA